MFERYRIIKQIPIPSGDKIELEIEITNVGTCIIVVDPKAKKMDYPQIQGVHIDWNHDEINRAIETWLDKNGY